MIVIVKVVILLVIHDHLKFFDLLKPILLHFVIFQSKKERVLS